jgi:uncharacterized membrane protein
LLGYLFAALSAVGFGAGQFFTQVGMRSGQVRARQGLLINLVAANFTLLLALALVWRQGPVSLNLEGMGYFVAAGLLAPLAGRGLNIAAIKRIGATRTASLGMGESLYAALIAWIVIGQTVSPLSLLGIGLLVAGTVLFLNEAAGEAAVLGRGPARNPAGPGTLGGAGLALLSGLFFAVAGVLRQLGLDALPSAVVGAAVGTFAALLVSLADLLLSGPERSGGRLSAREALPLALAGIAASAGMLCFFLALQQGAGVAGSTALKNTTPLVTFLLARAFLAHWERLGWRLAALVLLVVTGAVLIALGRA